MTAFKRVIGLRLPDAEPAWRFECPASEERQPATFLWILARFTRWHFQHLVANCFWFEKVFPAVPF